MINKDIRYPYDYQYEVKIVYFDFWNLCLLPQKNMIVKTFKFHYLRY